MKLESSERWSQLPAAQLRGEGSDMQWRKADEWEMEERKHGYCYRAIIVEKRTAELDSEVHVKI